MGTTAAEQYMLELINRTRLDPQGEIQRLSDAVGVSTSGTLSAGNGGSSSLPSYSLDPLAGNYKLDRAAEKHVDWMLQMDRFSHTGDGGSNAGARMEVEGYDSNQWAENIAFRSLSQNINTQNNVEILHRNLFESDGHRANLLDPGMREIGVGIDAGDFYGVDSTIAAQSFGRAGSDRFLTGVVYNDSDEDDFYSIGEGEGGIRLSTSKNTTSSENAGGYNLSMGPDGRAATVTIVSGGNEMRVRIEDKRGNVKLDLINGDTLASSSSLTLGSGAKNATLLGIDKLSVTGNGAQNTLTGNDVANFMKGNNGGDKIFGEGGNDKIYGGRGQDYIKGGEGRDQLFGGDHDDRLFGDSGKDILQGGRGYDKLYGGDGDDKLFGESDRDILQGGRGYDKLYGGDQSDEIYGNWGQDYLKGGRGYDKLYGGDGHDKIFGEFGRDILQGGDGNDELFGGEHSDRLFGGAGQDYLRGGRGYDNLFGGDGHDKMLGESGQDFLQGGNGNDALFGGNHDDRLFGDSGQDYLKGGRGYDNLFGGDGDDKLFGESGRDILQGGNGNDQLFGGEHSDRLFGGEGQDYLRGGRGYDNLFGGDGHDKMLGESGQDFLQGGNGNDVLFGGNHDDRLDGGLGNDILTGGNHADTFVFRLDGGQDQITDFDTDADILVLETTLWSGEMTEQEVIDTYATVTADGILFTFEADTLLLHDLSDLSAMSDQISLI